MEKRFCNKTFQQLLYFSSLRSMSLMSKYLLNPSNNNNNNKVEINIRSFTTERKKQQKSDPNQRENQYKYRRSQRLSNATKYNRKKTNYDILGISANATHKEIKSAYYEKSKLCHPDLNQGLDAEQEFRRITDAYEVLGNKESKRIYDRQLFGTYSQSSETFNENVNTNTSYKDNNNEDSNHREDYTQFWKNRRRQNDAYSNRTESSNSRRTYGEDPLRYNTDEHFKQHFTDEMQNEYAEQIRKRDEKIKEMLSSEMKDGSVMAKALLTILAFVSFFEFISHQFDFDKRDVKQNKSNKNTNNVSQAID